MIVMNNYDGIIRGIQQHTGKIVWQFKAAVGNSGGGSATIVGDVAYIGSWDKYVSIAAHHTALKEHGHHSRVSLTARCIPVSVQRFRTRLFPCVDDFTMA